MAHDPHELERRVALIQPDFLVRGFNFAAVLALAERHASAEAMAALRRPLERRVLGFFNYPAADFVRLSFAAADGLAPHFGGHDGALRAIGRACAGSLLETTVGRSLLGFLRGSPPSTLLKHVHTGYTMAVSFGERLLAEVSEGRARLVFREDPMPPPFHEGILITGLGALGLEATVEGTALALDESEYRVAWR